MNIIADYYDVAALAKLSCTKIQSLLVSQWSAEPFCDLLRHSLGSTRDKDFLRMLGTEAAKHFDQLFGRHVFDEGGLGEELAPYALTKCIVALKAAKDHEMELETSLLSAKEEVEYETQRSERLSRNVDECVKLLESHDACRNPRCEAEFSCYLETKRSFNQPTYILRCASCNCRHK